LALEQLYNKMIVTLKLVLIDSLLLDMRCAVLIILLRRMFSLNQSDSFSNRTDSALKFNSPEASPLRCDKILLIYTLT